MRIINIKVTGKRRNKVEVTFNDSTTVMISPETLMKHNLSRGKECTEEEIEDIRREDERIRARIQAVKYASVRVVSKAQLKRHLLKKGFSDESVDAVVARLDEKGFIDDTRFAQLFIKDRMKLKPAGPRKLAADLRKRGVERHIIEEAVAPWEDLDTQREVARSLAEKKINTLQRYDQKKQRRKLYAYLERRGFDQTVIGDITREVLDGGEW